jgi:RNA polymerase sigma factor (sigma-70 family)
MDREQPDEGELWERARRNDGDAFGLLFDLHGARVYRRALGLTGNRADADDIAAAAFFEMWRRRGSVQLTGGSVLPWLLVTTVNLSRNTRRAGARYRRFLSSLPRESVTPGPDPADADTRDRLATSLRQLSPIDSALFVLTVLEDVSIAEAAEAVGLKPATARVRLHRARVKLRAELDDLNPIIRRVIEGNPI